MKKIQLLTLFAISSVLLTFSACQEDPEPTNPKYDFLKLSWQDYGVPWTYVLPADLNQDAINDLTYDWFRGSNWFDSAGYDVFYRYDMRILRSLYEDVKIAMYSDQDNTELLFLGDEINESLNWSESVELYGKRFWDHPGQDVIEYYSHPLEHHGEESFVAIRWSIDGKMHYGWLRLEVVHGEVLIYESAYNRIHSQEILVGQEE